MKSKYASAAKIGMDVSALFSPPRRMKVSEAVKKFMRVPLGAANTVPWESELTPYITEAMDLLSSREFDAVIFVSPARTGKTLGLVDGWVVYSITCDPGDMLLVQITQDKAAEHSKKRLARTFRSSPEVAKRLSPRRNDNNVHDKMFRDGSFLKIGWPSISIFSSSDYKRVALTDYDRFPADVDGEGDAFSLASKRTTTFMSAGMALVESSPGRDIVDTKWRRSSPHEAPPTTGILSLYNRGDRRRWYWPCPHCGDWFQPGMDNMVGYRDNPDLVAASEAARIQCPHCQALIQPEQKRELNNCGVWLKEGQVIDKDGVISGEARRSRIASFWFEGPAAGYQAWSKLTYNLLTAEEEYERTGSEESLKAVFNTDWGLPYQSRLSLDGRRSDVLMERAEPVAKRVVPYGVRFIVAIVDVQGGKNRRFVVQIVGYGSHGERWVIDRYNIRYSMRTRENGESLPVDPASYAEDWQLLRTDVLDKVYPLEGDSEQVMPVLAMAVDSGGEDGVTDTLRARFQEEQRQRISGIQNVFGMFGNRHGELMAQCIADVDCSVDAAKDKLLEALGRGVTPTNTLGGTQNTQNPMLSHIYAGSGNFAGDGIRASLMARAGFESSQADNPYNAMTMRELARMSLTERGVGVSTLNPMQMVGMAFTHSTSDFGNILLDVANKAILQGWEEAPETYELWTRKGQLSDFKTAHRVGMGGFNALRQVREGAEYKYVTTGDKHATIALATYGELFSITRQAIINDDLNMLTDVPMKLGRAAKSTIADLVYAILTANLKMSTDT